MNAATALGLLRRLNLPAFTTADAAAVLEQSIEAASKTLRRLEQASLLTSIRKGLWSYRDPVEPLAIVDQLTAPHLSYGSLQTALYLHGMISQVPAVIYVVSLARSHRIRTSVGTFSIHRVAPAFFGGFEVSPRSGVKLAGPEKALLDLFYLSGTRSRLFASLPELELPTTFRDDYAREWIAKIPAPRLRTLVTRRLDAVLHPRSRPGRPRRAARSHRRLRT